MGKTWRRDSDHFKPRDRKYAKHKPKSKRSTVRDVKEKSDDVESE